MKIGVDMRCLEEGRKTGVEEYTLNLLKNVFKLDKENSYVLFFNSWKNLKIDIDWIKKHSNVRIKKMNYPNKVLNLFFWYLNWPKIDKLLGDVDLFFMPNINFCALSSQKKLLITIHDLSYEIFPETFSFKRQLWHFFVNPKKLCLRSNAIISVSESTKNDLVTFYKINPEKITTIPSATNENFKIIDRNDPKMIAVKEKYNLPYYFILYLGTMEPRKNIVSLIKAYNQLRRLKNRDLDKYKLVIAGANGWKEQLTKEEIEKSPFKKDILSIGFIEPEEKNYLYNLASFFVYPSFLEGFGFPVLEAMQSGVPVIFSNNSSLPEIAGGAGISIDPERPDEIYNALKELILNKELKIKLREKGLKKAREFNWDKTAQDFLKLIKKTTGTPI